MPLNTGLPGLPFEFAQPPAWHAMSAQLPVLTYPAVLDVCRPLAPLHQMAPPSVAGGLQLPAAQGSQPAAAPPTGDSSAAVLPVSSSGSAFPNAVALEVRRLP